MVTLGSAYPESRLYSVGEAGRRASIGPRRDPMDNIRRVAIVACVIFAGALVGDLLQWLLPAHHLSDAKGVITTVQGLVTALLALVLGLLIWTSYGVYAQQHTEMLT